MLAVIHSRSMHMQIFARMSIRLSDGILDDRGEIVVLGYHSWIGIPLIELAVPHTLYRLTTYSTHTYMFYAGAMQLCWLGAREMAHRSTTIRLSRQLFRGRARAPRIILSATLVGDCIRGRADASANWSRFLCVPNPTSVVSREHS